MITLPELPYRLDALEPHVSAATLETHHGKHHAGYVKTVNTLIEGTPLADEPLEEIVRKSDGKLFNAAAQAWNHALYFDCLSPEGGGEPTGDLKRRIDASFGSFSDFRERFTKAAVGHFASGWAWLVQDGDRLEVIDTHDAGTPLRDGRHALLTCDVWEHAYYLDRRNERAKYVEAWWSIVNWRFAAGRLRA